MRILERIVGTAVIGACLVVLTLLAINAIDYVTDPRPSSGTDECEVKQVAIFKRPINRNESPGDYVREVIHACK